MEDDPRRHCLRAGFDTAAEDYQRTRPVCPPQLFGDLIDRAWLQAGGRVIEIGCGTGQATVPLAERGLAVTAVELGAELAAIARRRVTGFPAAEVVTCSFEDWLPRGAPFDAVVAVISLHWIDRSFVTPSLMSCCAPGVPCRSRMPVGTARGRRTLLDGCARGLPGGGI
jgi:protein-L-isoaspartate O-methyltransferase